MFGRVIEDCAKSPRGKERKEGFRIENSLIDGLISWRPSPLCGLSTRFSGNAHFRLAEWHPLGAGRQG